MNERYYIVYRGRVPCLVMEEEYVWRMVGDLRKITRKKFSAKEASYDEAIRMRVELRRRRDDAYAKIKRERAGQGDEAYAERKMRARQRRKTAAVLV